MPKKKTTANQRNFGDVFVEFVTAAHEYMIHPDTPESGAEAVQVLIIAIGMQLTREDLKKPLPLSKCEPEKPAPKRRRRVEWPTELDV